MVGILEKTGANGAIAYINREVRGERYEQNI